MDEEIRRHLENLRNRAPDGTPDLPSIVQGGTRARRRRFALQVVATTAVLSSIAIGISALIPSGTRGPLPQHHDDGVFVPAEKGEKTYVLTDFEIRYPWAPIDERRIPEGDRARYCSSRGEWECGHRNRQAAFASEWHWATNKYPGEVQCRVTLFGEDREVVGSQEWGLSGLEPQSRQPLVVGMHVSAPPKSAEAACEAGAYASGPGIRVTFVRAENYTPTHVRGDTPPPDRIRLIFEAKSLAHDHIDSRMCFMTVWFDSGDRRRSKFTTNQRPGTWKFETGFPATDPVKNAKIRCRAIRASDS